MSSFQMPACMYAVLLMLLISEKLTAPSSTAGAYVFAQMYVL